jgi:hypothetical protein
MSYRKICSTPWLPEDRVSVTIEPRAGVSDGEVLRLLERAGAHNVNVVAPGFISADASPTSLDAVQRIAHISRKPEHQLHGW